MNAPDRQVTDWVEANQRLMVAEIARLKRRLSSDEDAESLDAAVESARAEMPAPAAIDHLGTCFGLSAFERDVLLLCAGMEMDEALAQTCESIIGEPRRQGATFGLALAALPAPHWSALAPVGPLRRWRLLEIDDTGGPVRSRLRIDERILHYLAGVNYMDTRLGALLRPAAPAVLMADEHRAICGAVRTVLERSAGRPVPVVWLSGNDAAAQADIATVVATALGLALYAARGDDIPTGHAEIEALATLWEREAILLDSALLVTGGPDPLPASTVCFIEQLHGLVFVSAGQPQTLERPTLRFTVDKPGPVEQKHLWQQALGANAALLNGALDGIASQFKLSARTIQAESVHLAPELATSDQPDLIMWSTCRSAGRSKLDELAQRIDSSADWDDLILPEPQKSTLQQIGVHVRNRLKVHLEWGFADSGARGLGISALFAGESGTGKTMAAEVLARELQLDLHRIDLAAVVSKYIGETEKNLRRIFDAAEDSGSILLFDEADALFGKRSEVKDSHDRFANIEISYLLQRMEAYRGLAILTTNLKGALDAAFQRRLTFIAHFPFPDQAQREAIWRNVFPSQAPRGNMDYRKLSRLSVTGGSIRNIAVNAAFRAAELNESISMAHLLQAARSEASKREQPLSDTETRGWE